MRARTSTAPPPAHHCTLILICAHAPHGWAESGENPVKTMRSSIAACPNPHRPTPCTSLCPSPDDVYRYGWAQLGQSPDSIMRCENCCVATPTITVVSPVNITVGVKARHRDGDSDATMQKKQICTSWTSLSRQSRRMVHLNRLTSLSRQSRLFVQLNRLTAGTNPGFMHALYALRLIKIVVQNELVRERTLISCVHPQSMGHLVLALGGEVYHLIRSLFKPFLNVFENHAFLAVQRPVSTAAHDTCARPVYAYVLRSLVGQCVSPVPILAPKQFMHACFELLMGQ
jgi:hypothetical protein